ncbi:hypothetical protein DQ04_13511020 [Trypanosoma grayi]|uniref:hypothetical protein n=1 Tax=Trypanosoma grayi TaxID=71804 RepID=UPI0004F4AA7E|nr:hypothetical protein DQ04_13511020 [Trypanosoma grayi]KEG06522.1 hypothetical protein DQ04_13511020 [Trypanosoma grayi]
MNPIWGREEKSNQKLTTGVEFNWIRFTVPKAHSICRDVKRGKTNSTYLFCSYLFPRNTFMGNVKSTKTMKEESKIKERKRKCMCVNALLFVWYHATSGGAAGTRSKKEKRRIT